MLTDGLHIHTKYNSNKTISNIFIYKSIVYVTD